MQETQKLQDSLGNAEIQARDEAGSKADFLGVLVVIAENIKLLVLGSLAVGLIALGICFVVPQTYQSVAIFQADQTAASLMTTTTVLDPIISSLKLEQGVTLQDARAELQRQIKTAVGRTDKMLTLTVSAPSAAQAQAIAVAVLERTFVESRPKENVRTRLETQLAEAKTRLRNAQDVGESLRKRLENSAISANISSEVARGYAELLSASGAAQTQIGILETQLEGLSNGQRIQAPTLPERPSQPKKALIAIGATLATGLALLVFVFMRRGLQAASVNQTHAEKLSRIRKSLGIK